MVLTVAFPLLYMIIISFKSRNEFAANPYDVINTKWTIDNYIKMFADYHVQKKLWNSFFVSGTTALFVCLFAVPAAYCMLYIDKRIRKIIVLLMIVFIFMPTQVTLASKYRMFLALGLVDTRFSVIVSGIADWLPTSTLLLFLHIQGLDKSVIRAAKLDGCNESRIVVRILTPIIIPAISIIFINSFTGMWNDFLTPMYLLRSESKQLLIPALTGLIQRYRSNLPFQLAGYVCGIIPTLLIYTVFKNNILEGFKK